MIQVGTVYTHHQIQQVETDLQQWDILQQQAGIIQLLWGYNSEASGNYSTAMGQLSEASGNYSTAIEGTLQQVIMPQQL